MLERFPNNLPKHRENVIPADSEKSFEEVSGEVNTWLLAVREGLGGKALNDFRARSLLRREEECTGLHGKPQAAED